MSMTMTMSMSMKPFWVLICLLAATVQQRTEKSCQDRILITSSVLTDNSHEHMLPDQQFRFSLPSLAVGHAVQVLYDYVSFAEMAFAGLEGEQL